MAAVTIRTVPHVTPHSGVLRICLRLRMAIRADEDLVVGRVRVTIGALRVLVWQREPGVIESRSSPSCGGMARLACSRKTRSDVIGIGCPLVIGLVARIAVSRSGGKVAVNVAT